MAQCGWWLVCPGTGHGQAAALPAPCQLLHPETGASTLTERLCWGRFLLAAAQECLGWAGVGGEEENPNIQQEGEN